MEPHLYRHHEGIVRFCGFPQIRPTPGLEGKKVIAILRDRDRQRVRNPIAGAGWQRRAMTNGRRSHGLVRNGRGGRQCQQIAPLRIAIHLTKPLIHHVAGEGDPTDGICDECWNDQLLNHQVRTALVYRNWKRKGVV
ncbi:hypothetical protein SDC9_180893 [bioreactor metagenome]|uniref:Uncharacterized protein n=1 Tax=bioreactor metagenome TaxID=1076179 RepID=A0A645H4K0_9ZZZZ